MEIERTENSIMLTNMNEREKEFFEDKILFWEFLCSNETLLNTIAKIHKLEP